MSCRAAAPARPPAHHARGLTLRTGREAQVSLATVRAGSFDRLRRRTPRRWPNCWPLRRVLAGALLPAPHLQDSGIGTAVLRGLLDQCDRDRTVVRRNVLQGCPARRLYERHGFSCETEDPVDVFMLREPA